MNEIWLPPIAKRGLRRWLSGRAEVDGICRMRLFMFKGEMAEMITTSELMALIDNTGYGCLDAMMGRQVSRG